MRSLCKVRGFLAALTLPLAALGCGDGGGFPDAAVADAPPPPGTFSMAWTVENTSGQAISCDSIGAQSMTALLRNRGAQGGSTQVYTCSALAGTSEQLPPGLYDVDYTLVGPGGTPPSGLIGTAPSQLAFEIRSGENTALTPVTFTVDATGNLALSIDALQAGGNCAAVGSGGAGITEMSLTLERATGAACAPVTFAISAGASGTAGTYTVDCASPALVPCLNSDQTLTATGLTSGAYVVRVRGYKAAQPAPACWTNNDSIPVPPLGRTLTRTLNLALQTQTAGC